MKKLLYISSIFIVFLALSCEKDENDDSTPPQPVQNITVTAGYGELMFAWTLPSDTDLYYVDITYVDSKGNKMSEKVSHYSSRDTIRGFADTKECTFYFTAYDKNNNASTPVMIKASPLSPPFIQVASTIKMVPDFGGARITWNNETGKSITMRVSYKNNEGALITTLFTSKDPSYTAAIAGLNTNKRTFTVVVADILDNTSDKQDFEITPLAETKMVKTTWSVEGFSSEEPAENPNGFAKNILDGNVNSFWHSKWNGGQPGYPHWIIVDMKQEITISRFECFRRQGDNRGQTKHQFLTSIDGATWIDQGTFDFDPNTNDGQSFRMISNPKARYFKYVATQGPNFYAFLGELNVYGSAN